MKEYHKIQTVFLRSPESNYKELMEDHYALPEFAYLAKNHWQWTEKIDGTNIRVMWDGQQVMFGGKTEAASIPAHLVNYLQKTFTPENMQSAFPSDPHHKDPMVVCLYGEGYGMKIQKGGNYLPVLSGLSSLT